MLDWQRVDAWETRFVAPWPAPHETGNICWEYGVPQMLAPSYRLKLLLFCLLIQSKILRKKKLVMDIQIPDF